VSVFNEAIDPRGTRLLQRDAQIEIAAIGGVRRLAHRLQRTDERVHVRLVGAEDVQEDVAQRSALRGLRAQGLVVDAHHER